MASPRWVVEPNPASVWLGEVRGRFGRSQAPQQPLAAGITGEPAVALRLATPSAVPGAGRARAILSGLEGAASAIELIDIDTGQIQWRSKECAGPVVAVTESATVCASTNEIAGIGHDGKRRWVVDGMFLAATDDRVVVMDGDHAIVVAADDGGELARVALPRGIGAETVIASCGAAGRELFASGQDGMLVRIAEAAGGPAVQWRAPIGAVIAEIDACTGESIVVRAGAGAESELIAIARATGAITGRVDGVRGSWRARDGSEQLEIATAAGVARWPRDLSALAARLALPPLGELIAARGERRLVRATDHSAVLLDRSGVAAHLAFAWAGAALGERSAIASTWSGSAGETAHRIGLPARLRRALRLPRATPIAVPAELRDLPPVQSARGAEIAKPELAMRGVAAAAIDPENSALIYAVTLERAAGDASAAGVAHLDLAARAWRWQRGDGCGTGAPAGIAVARGGVVCAARAASPPSATVTATSRDGAARWQWQGDNVDGVAAAGGIVLVHDADRLIFLDAETGRLRGRLASDDGAAMRAAAVSVAGATYAVTYERGRLVARLPAVEMLPLWSLAVGGVVRAIAPSQDGVLVELADGDAYRVDVRTAAVTPLPGVGLVWRARGDLITGDTAGGPIPGPAPPDAATSLQVTLFDLAGGVRARNDYALLPPIAHAFGRGAAGSPLVVVSGTTALVLDPRTGAPVRRVQLPDDAAAPLVFGTVVDGTPVAGALLGAPLRAVLF